MFGNWLFKAIVISTIAFQIVIVEFLSTFANTVLLSWELWLASILIGAVSLVMAVVLKCIPVDKSKRRAVSEKHHDGYEPLPSGPKLA
ncbi:P-type Ca(2+) transporter [Sarracenia purpurea var. burkii]